MQDFQNAFVTRSFLRSVWALEYEAFKNTTDETTLLDRLTRWAGRVHLGETSSEAAFIQTFFHDTWGYVQSGQAGAEAEFTLWPQFKVADAGATGGAGRADLAIGYFKPSMPSPIPQVVCEFKDIKSSLDADQKRKGNTRSPVRQCLDYLSHSRKGMIGSEPIVPTWGLVTDMNEFRLYWYDRGHHQSVRFVILPRDLFQGRGLLATDEATRFDRFLFAKLFHRDTLLTKGGVPRLRALIAQRRFRDRELESTFYGEYRAFRENLYAVLLEENSEGTPRFPGTRGRLVRLAQTILDRLIFVFFCEDMGQAIAFPPKLLQDFLTARSNDPYFDPHATTIWQDMLRLFHAMNVGSAFGGKAINQFNGGLFAPDPALELLHVPNLIFCQHMQGQNEASVHAFKKTVLYLCATYNYASDIGSDTAKRVGREDNTKSLGLYTLGRIFEQSITELEILEAEADDRLSLNKENKRKRDGVYYTPEWVVEKIVEGTLQPPLADLRASCGWPADGEGLPTLPAIDAYRERLKSFTVLDPACGSGAFLITALRYLVDEVNRVIAVRQVVTGGKEPRDDDGLVRELLTRNIYGVDINPASIEITRLALWLHSARGDRPLSSLDATIRVGNSLIGPDFYKGIQIELYNAEAQERINCFDWEAAFPEVFSRGGFDAVVGNPPYVKLQNFRRVHADMAAFLVEGRPALGIRPFESTRTGNFDLYLPFIEKGISLLNEGGRLGYIAPSMWTVNEHGAGLRSLIGKKQQLDRWIDFKSFQVFEEATTYTALQFFSKERRDAIGLAQAPQGIMSPNPFADAGSTLPYSAQVFGERWLMLAGQERTFVNRLCETCRPLGDPLEEREIFVGIQTSADAVYYLKRVGVDRYLCSPEGKPRPAPFEVDIEDALMKPIVSGVDAKRYVRPATATHVLFPYMVKNGSMQLIEPKVLDDKFTKAWTYLSGFKDVLRGREAKRNEDGSIASGPVNDDLWYRYVYPKNLDRQQAAKLIVPRLVTRLACAVDEDGSFYLDNVDVGGVISGADESPWFLAAVLNGRVANFVFRRISKPFRGDYLSANKQFIAPLPVPSATPEQRAAISDGAKALQAAHTRRRDLLVALERRLSGSAARKRPETWLFPTLKPKRDRLMDAPKALNSAQARAWAKERYEIDLAVAYERISGRLRPGATMSAELHAGELLFLIDTVPVIDRIFVTPAEADFINAQWRVAASTFSLKERITAVKLADALRSLAPMINAGLVQQVIELQRELMLCDADIKVRELTVGGMVEQLYDLSPNELRLLDLHS